MRFLIILLLVGLFASGQQSENKKYSIDTKAKQLNDSAMFLAMQTMNYDEAIVLLDKATQIDSNYLTAYGNKLIFLMELRQFDKALLTAKNLVRIQPNAPENYGTFGLIYEFKGDTFSANQFFLEAAKRYEIILDTMSTENKAYDQLLMNKAINLVLVGKQLEGNNILNQLYHKQKDHVFKEMLTLFIDKSKKDILDYLMQTK